MASAPDPRIAAYIEEISQPGIPYISYSHITLRHLYGLHGQELVDRLIREHFHPNPETTT